MSRIEESGARLVADLHVPSGEARVVALSAGQVLQVVDLEGQQVGDLAAYRTDRPDEYLSRLTPVPAW